MHTYGHYFISKNFNQSNTRIWNLNIPGIIFIVVDCYFFFFHEKRALRIELQSHSYMGLKHKSIWQVIVFEIILAFQMKTRNTHIKTFATWKTGLWRSMYWHSCERSMELLQGVKDTHLVFMWLNHILSGNHYFWFVVYHYEPVKGSTNQLL